MKINKSAETAPRESLRLDTRALFRVLIEYEITGREFE